MEQPRLIEKQTLTNIANAIREKSSTTDEIKPSAMADLIRAISGGLPMAMGTFVLENNETSITVTHGLKTKPDILVIFNLSEWYDNYGMSRVVMAMGLPKDSVQYPNVTLITNWSNLTYPNMSVINTCEFTDTDITYTCVVNSEKKQGYFSRGKEYMWIAFKKDEVIK